MYRLYFLFVILFFGCNSDTGTKSIEPANKCAAVTCLNGGACSNGACLCPAGFSGASCETKADKCASMSCQNGGSCSNGTCSCPAGFSGGFCETKIDQCANIVCQNGGTCSNGSCSCTERYTGVNCQSQKTPVSIIITQIVVNKFPVLAPDGSNWDAFGGKPDLLVTLDQGTPVLYTSDVKQDITEGVVSTFTTRLPVTISQISQSLNVRLYDSDLTVNDPMGGYAVTLYSSSNAFPSRIRLGSGTNLDIDLFITYQF